jgi:hypothetical protein
VPQYVCCNTLWRGVPARIEGSGWAVLPTYKLVRERELGGGTMASVPTML